MTGPAPRRSASRPAAGESAPIRIEKGTKDATTPMGLTPQAEYRGHRQEEGDGRQREIEEKGQQVRRGEGPGPEQRGRHHRVVRSRFPENEGCQRGQPGGQGQPARAVKARFGAGQGHRGQAEAGGDQRRARQIERPPGPSAVELGGAPDEPESEPADGNVQREDGAPGIGRPPCQQKPAKDRPERGGDSRSGCPEAERPPAVFGRRDPRDDGHRSGHHEGRAEALQGARGDHGFGGRRHGADDGRDDEQGDAREEHARQSEAVAERAADQDKGGQDKQIGIGEPLRLRQRRAQRGAHGGQGDGHDRSVDEPHGRGEDRGDQDQPPAPGVKDTGCENGHRRGLLRCPRGEGHVRAVSRRQVRLPPRATMIRSSAAGPWSRRPEAGLPDAGRSLRNARRIRWRWSCG